ncbi:MAG: exodeoxyribonuclease VII large subunit [Methanomicrobiales archaeon]
MDWFNKPDETPGGQTTPLQVSELSAIIEGLLDDARVQGIWVKGEVTNYTHHSRGHRYFSLSEKGEGGTAAVIKCVMWRTDAQRLAFIPAEGMVVTVSGTVRLYAPHGSYQLQVKEMTKAGLGEKYLLVEQWKRELAAEGCFVAERKRHLPRFPERVGVVTSETGAVIHDIVTVITRRYPVEIVISPTAVQGEQAHCEIAHAIRRLIGRVDVVIVARGGGSFEDLFAFNQPDVVRAIAACPIPVVSAIGHEVDFTLADLAADLRAPTPSAAAELVVPDRAIILLQLCELKSLLAAALQGRIAWAREELTGMRDRLRPQRLLHRIEERKTTIADLADRLERACRTRIERERLLLAETRTALESRSPLAVLARGYCVAEQDGHIVKNVGGITKDDRMKIRFYDGNTDVIVEQVNHERDL